METPENKKDKRLNIKLSNKDQEKIKENAIKYANGNISEWIRISAAKEIKEGNKDESQINSN